MADVTNTTLTAKGKKQDLQDIVMQLNTQDTPFLTLNPEGSTIAKTAEWVEDELDAPTDMALMEGADMDSTGDTSGAERQNYTQIFGRAVKVSGSLEAISTAGNKGHMAREIAKAGMYTKTCVERAMVGVKQAKSLQSGTVGRKMDSALNQISAETTNTAQANRAFSEDLVTDVLQKMYTAGGTSATTIMMSASKKVQFSKFVDEGKRTRDFGESTKLVNAVDIYVSDFGTLAVVPNRHFKDDSVMIFDPKMWEASWLRRIQTKDLAKNGDAEKKMVVGEVTVKHMHSKASGLIEKLS